MFWYIILFFFVHWFLSLFFHTAFLHRYGSHGMFTMGKTTERVFYFFTWFFQGSSFLVPRAYAVMHRMHHAYSDTKADPHSPHFFKDVFGMMWETKKIYQSFATGTLKPEPQFGSNLPVWDSLDRFGDRSIVRISFGILYSLFYFWLIFFHGVSAWWLLLLPVHYLIGPVQGATVNWCGHKYGYRNFDNGDHSRNTGNIGILLGGELFQNNHHRYPDSPNFAKRWFELDPTYLILKVLNGIKVIRFKDSKVFS
jgi:stearoyl-CoA desaturase (delta-9 desaturase)